MVGSLPRDKVAPVMTLSRILIPLLLAFFLLFAQQGGAVHALQHAMAEQAQDQSLPHDKLCDLCAVYAQIGSAIGSHAVSFAPAGLAAFFPPLLFAAFRAGLFAAFAARAPPFSV